MKQATKEQKQWMDDITEFIQEMGFLQLYCEEFDNYDFDRHHVLGKTAKQDKVPIGHWFIIPVPKHLHDVHSNDPNNVTHFKHNFTKIYGYQREIFKRLSLMMWESGYAIPPDDVMYAIERTRA